MATLAKISFGYGKIFTLEERIELNKVLPFDKVDVTREESTSLYGDYIMFIEDALNFGTFDVKDALRGPLSERLSNFTQRETSIVNEKCHVSVAGLGTLNIDTVQVAEDFCTEQLQYKLNEGWRILAICVQPDQRRPDYILGKTLNK